MALRNYVDEKRRIKSSITQLQRVQTWQLVILLILSLVISATFLRINNIGMIERRTAVKNADEMGDQETTRERLFALQRYTTSHMNADTGDIYLEGQYNRDTKKAIDAASQGSSGTNINLLADQACKAQFGGYSQAYVQCFAGELAKYPPGKNDIDKAQLPNVSLYKHSFASPLWSPDFAGLSVLISVLLVFMIVVRLISLVILRALLHRHYQSI